MWADESAGLPLRRGVGCPSRTHTHLYAHRPRATSASPGQPARVTMMWMSRCDLGPAVSSPADRDPGPSQDLLPTSGPQTSRDTKASEQLWWSRGGLPEPVSGIRDGSKPQGLSEPPALPSHPSAPRCTDFPKGPACRSDVWPGLGLTRPPAEQVHLQGASDVWGRAASREDEIGVRGAGGNCRTCCTPAVSRLAWRSLGTSSQTWCLCLQGPRAESHNRREPQPVPPASTLSVWLSWKSGTRFWQGCAPPATCGGSFPASGALSSHAVSCKDTSPALLGATLLQRDLIANYICDDSISKEGHILKSRTSGLQHSFSGGPSSAVTARSPSTAQPLGEPLGTSWKSMTVGSHPL